MRQRELIHVELLSLRNMPREASGHGEGGKFRTTAPSASHGKRHTIHPPPPHEPVPWPASISASGRSGVFACIGISFPIVHRRGGVEA